MVIIGCIMFLGGLFFGGGCCNLGGLFDVLIETLKIILEMEKDHTFIYVLNETTMCRLI